MKGVIYRMERRENAVKMGGKPVTLLGKEIKVGDKAPEFTALKTDNSEISLEDLKNKIRIISVVPSVDTGVCELQTISFNEKASELGDDVVIITISMDLPFAQKRFCGAHGIDDSIVVSDHKDASFGLNYGFLMEETRLLARGVVIVDKEGTVQYVEYVDEVSNHPDYDKAIEETKKLIK